MKIMFFSVIISFSVELSMKYFITSGLGDCKFISLLKLQLTGTEPPIICSRQHFQILFVLK